MGELMCCSAVDNDMTQAPDEHLLAVDEGKLSPVVVVATILLAVLFVMAFLYRIGVTIL